MLSNIIAAVSVLALASAAYSQNIINATHFEHHEVQRVGERLQRHNVRLTPSQRKVLLADQDRNQKADSKVLALLRPGSTADLQSVPFTKLVELLRSPIVLQEFRSHCDTLVRFRANVRLAAVGDIQAAKLLCNLFDDGNIRAFDARLIKTILLDIGIQPATATPDTIIMHLQGLQSGPVRLRQGEMIKDFTAIDSKGREFKLSDFRGKDVLIHFWATNCGPCMAEMPDLRKKIGAIDTEKVEVIFVSLDYDRNAFLEVIEELGIPCRHVFDGLSIGGVIPKHFRIDRMPIDIVIDRDGEFVSYSRDSIDYGMAND
ncbi:MAG: TlpA disulfide reductase family protein [Planctomycetota bacterium]